MWQAILWVSAIAVAFCIWDSLSRANAELESSQRAGANPNAPRPQDSRSLP